MDLILQQAEAADYKRIKQLYKKAFPREERAPFFLIRNRAEKGKAQMLIVKEHNLFIGFAYLLCYLDLAYLFYFAIEGDKRGAGYGTKVLDKLQEKYKGKRLFLAREQLDQTADNYEQRVKRHQFYLHNGFKDLPCKIKEANVIYDVMGIGGMISAKEYDVLISQWSGKWIKKLIDMRILE